MKKIMLILAVIAIAAGSYLITQDKDLSSKNNKKQEKNLKNNAVKDKANNKSNDGDSKMITLPSGLKYIALHSGNGETTAKPGQVVSVHYTGWLEKANGEPDLDRKFDSSVDRGEPFKFNVGIGQVIKGWDEALLAMRKGDKWRLIIPSNLGYGDRGYPGVIPGKATLIFDVELLDIK